MGPRKLLIGVIVIDGVLLIILCLCLVLGISVATLEPTAPSVVELATDQPTASETLQPSPTPSITPTPTQTVTPTPIPTMALVTPLPTAAIEEPTKLPYVFPSPIRIPGNTPPTPTVIGPR